MIACITCKSSSRQFLQPQQGLKILGGKVDKDKTTTGFWPWFQSSCWWVETLSCFSLEAAYHEVPVAGLRRPEAELECLDSITWSSPPTHLVPFWLVVWPGLRDMWLGPSLASQEATAVAPSLRLPALSVTHLKTSGYWWHIRWTTSICSRVRFTASLFWVSQGT